MESSNNTQAKVILVDLDDHPTGITDKQSAHEKGLLHRSVTVFLFNHKGDWLLQRRTAFKYHSGGLWTNTCCTHPLPGEYSESAAHRRLFEEMGLDCPLKELFCHVYQAQVNSKLTEYECTHVFAGHTNDLPDVNPFEVCDWKFLPPAMIHFDTQAHPERYAVWFRHLYQQVLSQQH